MAVQTLKDVLKTHTIEGVLERRSSMTVSGVDVRHRV